MSENDQAAYVIGMAANIVVTALGMHAENMQRQACGNSMAYGDEAFFNLIENSGMHHNGILTTLRIGI